MIYECLCCGAKVTANSAGWVSCPNCLVAVKVPDEHLRKAIEEVNYNGDDNSQRSDL